MDTFIAVSGLIDVILLNPINDFDIILNFTLDFRLQKLLSFLGLKFSDRIQIDPEQLTDLNDNRIIFAKLIIMQKKRESF